MIQRIQTIYLLLVAFIMIAMLFFPLGEIFPETGDASSKFDAFGVHGQDNSAVWFLFVFPVSCTLLSILTIFFYNRRKLQIKLGYLTLFIFVLIYIVGIFFLWNLTQKQPLATISLTIVSTFPLIAFILEILAIRGIKKDEKLIRSLSRLRS